MSTAAQLRVNRDIAELDLPCCIIVKKIETVEKQQFAACFRVEIRPEEGYYTGGKFAFKVTVPFGYPFEAPKVQSFSRIYHPNIYYDTGAVCLNVLRLDWSPALSLHCVILGLLNLLLEPSGEDPLEQGELTMSNLDENIVPAIVPLPL